MSDKPSELAKQFANIAAGYLRPGATDHQLKQLSTLISTGGLAALQAELKKLRSHMSATDAVRFEMLQEALAENAKLREAAAPFASLHEGGGKDDRVAIIVHRVWLDRLRAAITPAQPEEKMLPDCLLGGLGVLKESQYPGFAERDYTTDCTCPRCRCVLERLKAAQPEAKHRIGGTQWNAQPAHPTAGPTKEETGY